MREFRLTSIFLATLLAGTFSVSPLIAQWQEPQLPVIDEEPRNGMTWQKVAHDSNFSIDHVDCYGCNAYTGDTSCSTALPILCINIDGSPNPGVSTSLHVGWIGGNIALTLPVYGTSLLSLSNANSICQAYHGAGWQMAEFHHSLGGWSWWSHGNVSSASRFWVYINDQPANCWD